MSNAGGVSTKFDLAAYLQQRQQWVEDALAAAVPVRYPERVYEAMRYSLLGSGKRLRPIFCLASCELGGGTVAMAMPTACALEMVHTMSLIHDDLPAMDNDDYRRGRLTNHKIYGEAIAILSGDGLLAYAFEWLVRQTQGVAAEALLEVVARLGHAVAATGLVGGQVVDLESEGKSDVTVETLHFIHTHKTGALFEVSVVSGAILAGGTQELIQALTHYARNVGLAFQIVDDILDITSTAAELGKTAGKDLQAQKVTYPSLWGIEESRRQAKQLIQEAQDRLAPWGEPAVPLQALAEFVVARSH
jgi:geranylgeranyl diphosphate synthase type II